MNRSIVSPGRKRAGWRTWVAAAVTILVPVGLIVGFVLYLASGVGAAASLADMQGSPVRVAGPGGDRVYMMTSQWRTFTAARGRGSRSNLLIDVWAFNADDARPVWKQRLVDQRSGVNMGRELLGAQGGVLWLLDGQRLVGLRLADGAVQFDSTSLEAANPQLKGLIPVEARYYKFDRGGLSFTAADGRAWRLTGDGAKAAPAGAEPKDTAPGVTAPVRIAGGNGTSAFYSRGAALLGARWLGLLHEDEIDMFRKAGSLGGLDPQRYPRMKLWSARIVQEKTFFGPRPKYVDFAPLPEAPEFLQPALLAANENRNVPIFARNPDSVFVLHRDRLGDQGKLQLSRVSGPAGKVVWTIDLPVYALEAVMPGERSVVLIGPKAETPLWRSPNDTRPDAVDQLISVDLATGRMGVYGFRVKPGKPGEIPASSTKTP